MSSFANTFNIERFGRVLRNDLVLLQGRKIAFASLALFALGLLVYVTNAQGVVEETSQLAFVCFMFLLFGGGQVFTSMIFNDMHHPLERFQYLMLPCSNLERFVSRYFITSPFFIIYAVILFKVFEAVANGVSALLWDGLTVPALDLGSNEVRQAIVGYFLTHIFIFTGAVWFRGYALIKTWATGMLLWTACAVVMFLAIRIIYWDSFISLFVMNPDGPFPNIEFSIGPDASGTVPLWQKLAMTAFLLWTAFLAYLGLKEHEVQDGL